MADHRTPSEPVRSLQVAARFAAEYVSQGTKACRVVVYADTGKCIDIAIPSNFVDPHPQNVLLPSGWHFTDRTVSFDGALVTVALSRLKLLRALVEAEAAMTAKELTALVFDSHTDEANTRYHIRELRRELKAAFTFDGEVIQGEGDGYRLVLR